MMYSKTIAAAVLIDSLETNQDYITTFDTVVVKKETGELFFNDLTDKKEILEISQEILSKYLNKMEDKIKSEIYDEDSSKEYDDCLYNCDVNFKYSYSIYNKITPSTNYQIPDDIETIIENFEFSEVNIILENGETIKIN